MTMRLLVTGGAGFVGAEICRLARDRGHEVTSLDRREIDGGDIRSITGDIREPEAVLAAAQSADAIVHCAAVVGPRPAKQNPRAAAEVNVLGMASVLEASRALGLPVVHLSTATLYGNRPDLRPISEDDPTDPIGIYDATKLMAETLCDAYRKTWGCAVASIRTGFVYGAGHSTGEYFVQRALSGVPTTEPSGAGHPCDFTYVADLANGMVLAAEHSPLSSAIFNVTGGRLRTRGEFAAIVQHCIPQARIRQGPGQDPERHLRGACLIDRAESEFGYVPRFDLESGISDWVQKAVGGR